MRPTLKIILATGLALAALPAAADPIKDGKRVYMTKTCMACHGKNGAKPVMTFPALAGQNEKYLVQQLMDIKEGKRVGTVDPATGHPYVQGMVDVMHLVDENEIKDVAKYLAAQDPAAPKPLDPAPSEDELAAGEKAYNSLGCKSCHGKGALKPSNKVYPFIAGLNRDYLIRAMTEMRDKVRTNGKSKMMFGTIKKASDDDIAALATWLSQIDRNAQ
ncbi:c-type cytochrome [Thalassovita sp.]|uniref:c-type cytochrome n=1 Tax=Thalassovita sp. TaxID=1979401 RepID=UPI0029DE8FB7|nr:c-type cytochrome [Thalassovita sp.]